MSLAVIGLGNVLLGDDGFGPYVIELLRRRWEFPAGVELLDLGTPGLGLTGHLLGHETVILVDAAAIADAPGVIRVFEDADLDRLPAVARVSPHDPAVVEAIGVARAAGLGPREACLVAAAPLWREAGSGLSPVMRIAAEAAAEYIRRRVEARGFTARRLDDGRVEDDWWCRPVSAGVR